MSSKKGKLILFESGTDGAGKETQANLLVDYFMDKGLEVRKINFPRYDRDSSALIRQYLNGDFGLNPAQINPYIASSFYAVDRFASYLEDWKTFYEKGGIIVLDRYSSSNMLYQGAKMPDEKSLIEYVDWLIDFEHTKGGLPLPDQTFYLDVTPSISEKMREGRALKNLGKKDIHEENLEYMNTCYQTGLTLANYLNWTKIECTKNGELLDISSIHEKIIKELQI